MKEYFRNAVEILSIAREAGRLVIEDAIAKVDEWMSDYGDEE